MNMPPTFLQILKMNVSVPSWPLKNEVYRLKKKKTNFTLFFLYLILWVGTQKNHRVKT